MNLSLSDGSVQVFLNLLSACIHDVYIPTSTLSDEEWMSVVKLAKTHNVLPLIFEKASQREDFLKWKEYPRIATLAMTMVAEQTQRTAAFLDIYRMLLHEDLHPIVMKGILCRQLYGEYCDHRPSGDEDLLVSVEDFEKVQQVLVENGYVPSYDNVTSTQMEALQEMNYSNDQMGLSIDLHLGMVGAHSGLRQKMNEGFQNAFHNSREENIEGISITTMEYTEHLHFLIIHAFKHFTSGGFGIRLAMDILLYIQKYGQQCDWVNLQNALKEVHADLFLTDLIEIGNHYLGFQLELPGQVTSPDELLCEMLDCGVFGWGTIKRRFAGQVTLAAVRGQDNMKPSELNNFLCLVFPNKEYMKKAYPELREKTWLLPVYWVRRWMNPFKVPQKSRIRLAMESLRLGRKRNALLKKYDIL